MLQIIGSIRVPCGWSPFLGSTIFCADTRTEYQPAQLQTPPLSSLGIVLEDRGCEAGSLCNNEILETLQSLREVLFTSWADPIYDSPAMAGAASAFSPSTPGGQTPLKSVSSSIYLPEYIWKSLSEDQYASVISNISASFSLGDGSCKRACVDLTGEDDDTDAGRVPSTIIPVLPRFPGLDRAAIIAVFKYSFRPKKDLIKL